MPYRGASVHAGIASYSVRLHPWRRLSGPSLPSVDSSAAQDPRLGQTGHVHPEPRPVPAGDLYLGADPLAGRRFDDVPFDAVRLVHAPHLRPGDLLWHPHRGCVVESVSAPVADEDGDPVVEIVLEGGACVVWSVGRRFRIVRGLSSL